MNNVPKAAEIGLTTVACSLTKHWESQKTDWVSRFQVREQGTGLHNQSERDRRVRGLTDDVKENRWRENKRQGQEKWTLC